LINLLSQIPALAAVPAVSTNSSVGIAQDFTALLTELIGSFPEQSAINGQVLPTNDDWMAVASTAAVTHPHVVPADLTNLEINIDHELPKVPASDIRQEPEPKIQPPIQPLITTNAITNVHQPQLPLWVMAMKNTFSEAKPAELESTLPAGDDPPQPVSAKPTGQFSDSPRAPEKTEQERPRPRIEIPAGPKQDIPTIQATIVATVAAILDRRLANTQPQSETVPLDAKPSETNQLDPRTALINELAATHPDAQAVLADVKRLEINIDHEVPKLPPQDVQVKPEQSSQPLITTDAITNVQQPQLPLRVMAIQKVLAETKPAERKNTSPADDDPPQVVSNNSTPQLLDAPRILEKIEQPQPAQLIEVPDIPKLQVVRTVTMEVGDSQSQVIVRIEDRGSGMNLHFGTGGEMVHRTIESSVDSLVSALKQEKIDVSNVEVSRKSPIDKVRRMKEAH
jgi:hypothetical protein